MLIVSTIGRRTGALARWLVIPGFVLAVALLATVTVSEPAGLLFALWVSHVSVDLLMRRDRIHEETEEHHPVPDDP